MMNSPIRLSELVFPQVHQLIHRTRLGFIHLDNVLAFGKRDRDGRIDGYLAAYLPDECVLLFLRGGEAVNAAVLQPSGRRVLRMTAALGHMRAGAERGELTYCAAPPEQLAWMYQSCAVPLASRYVDAEQPTAFFPALAEEHVTGVLELIVNGRVSYLRLEQGHFVHGYFCDKPESVSPGHFIEHQLRRGADGRSPVLSAALFPALADLPAQAPDALISTYRELYWRIVDEVEKELPGEARRRAQRVCTGIQDAHRALALLSTPRDGPTPDAVVRADELSSALTDWSRELLGGVEVMMPGAAPKILKAATKEHRYVLQSSGFYGRLPWQVAW